MSQNRRRIVLIDKPFQVRFAFYMCGWISALCFIYPLIVKNIFDYFFRYTAHDPLGPELDSLFRVRREVLLLLGLTEISFLAMTFLMCVFVSHRIAGPLYKLRRTFQEFADGKFARDLKFRTKDYFQNIADEFNVMARTLMGRQQKEGELIGDALSRLEGSVTKAPTEVRREIESAIASLKQIQEQRAAVSSSAASSSADAAVTKAETVKEPA